MSLYKIASYALTKKGSFAGSAIKIERGLNGKKVLRILSPQDNLHPLEKRVLKDAQEGNNAYYRDVLHQAMRKDGVKLPDNLHEYDIQYHTVPKEAVVLEHLKNQHGMGKAIQAMNNPKLKQNVMKQFDGYVKQRSSSQKTHLYDVMHPDYINDLREQHRMEHTKRHGFSMPGFIPF